MNTLTEFSTYRTSILQAKAYRNLRHFMLQVLSKHDLTCSEWSILGVVCDESHNGGIRLSEIASLLDVERSFATTMVKKLQLQGYAKYKFDEDDGRVRLVVGTDKAMRKVHEIEQQLRGGMRG